MNAKNENPRPVDWPSTGEVKSVATLALEDIQKLIDDLKTEVNFELILEWTRKYTYKVTVEHQRRPGPSFILDWDHTVITDGEVRLLKRDKEYNYPIYNLDKELWEIWDFNIILVKYSYEDHESTENTLTIIAKDKNLLRQLAMKYKDYIPDEIVREFLSSSLTKTISLKLTETQYENFSNFSGLFIDKFRRMLSQVLRIEWDPVKGFMVNGEPNDSEELSKCLKIVESHIGISLDWEDMDYVIIADDTLIKISFFVSTSQPNVSLRITNKTTRVLKPEVIGDVVSAFYEAYERTMQEAQEKGFNIDSEEFDIALQEWLPTYLRLSSADEWEWEYK